MTEDHLRGDFSCPKRMTERNNNPLTYLLFLFTLPLLKLFPHSFTFLHEVRDGKGVIFIM